MSCPLEEQDPVTNPHLCDHMENLWSGAQLCTARLSVSGSHIPLGRRPTSSESVPAHRRGVLGVCNVRRDTNTHNPMAFSVQEAKLKGR